MSYRRALQVTVCVLLLGATAPLAAQTPNYSDLWWDQSDPGWALTVADHGDMISGVLYGYGPGGEAIWYLIPAGTFTGGKRFFAADLYYATGSSYNAPLIPNPSRYADGGETLHSDGPIKYYSGELQRQLYLKTHRIQPECDGVFNDDVPGTLSGNWFFSNWANLSFARDTYDPSQVRINVPYGMTTGVEGGVASTDPADTPPIQVTPASGKVLYTLTSARTGLPAVGAPLGYLLVQMIDATHVKAEFFGPSDSAPSDFTSLALLFTR